MAARVAVSLGLAVVVGLYETEKIIRSWARVSVE